MFSNRKAENVTSFINSILWITNLDGQEFTSKIFVIANFDLKSLSINSTSKLLIIISSLRKKIRFWLNLQICFWIFVIATIEKNWNLMQEEASTQKTPQTHYSVVSWMSLWVTMKIETLALCWAIKFNEKRERQKEFTLDKENFLLQPYLQI